MKTVAIVPMKINNRRLPQKNTKIFTNGKPLCHYILSTLLTVEGVDEVYVYCSNPDIQEFIPEGVKYLQRSTSLDQDTTKQLRVGNMILRLRQRSCRIFCGKMESRLTMS